MIIGVARNIRVTRSENFSLVLISSFLLENFYKFCSISQKRGTSCRLPRTTKTRRSSTPPCNSKFPHIHKICDAAGMLLDDVVFFDDLAEMVDGAIEMGVKARLVEWTPCITMQDVGLMGL